MTTNQNKTLSQKREIHEFTVDDWLEKQTHGHTQDLERNNMLSANNILPKQR